MLPQGSRPGINSPLTRHKLSDRTFLLLVAAAVVFKAWFTSDIRIEPFYGPHDELNYVEHALHLAAGAWFGAYDNLTLIKQPFFPIYLALVEQFGIALPTAHIIFDAVGDIVVCAALAPLMATRAQLMALFTILYFNPFSYDFLAWLALRSQINPTLALVSLACAAAVFIRRSRPAGEIAPWSIAFGVVFSAFWLTREEAVWLLPAVLLTLGVYLSWAQRRGRSTATAAVLLSSLPFVLLLLSVLAIKVVNGFTYGWYVTNEIQAPEFDSALNSLSRLAYNADPRIPVPLSALATAYSVSPAARELQPAFDGPNGQGWETISCGALPQLCMSNREIARGWFQFALRDAVSAAGHHTSGSEARRFYLELAREIDAACDAHTVPCHRKQHGLYPVPQLKDVGSILNAALAGSADLLLFKTLHFGAGPFTAPATNLIDDYVFVVRSVDIDNDPVRHEEGYRRQKFDIETQLGGVYSFLFAPALAATLVFGLWRFSRLFSHHRKLPDYLIVPSSSILGVASLVVVLAAVTVFSFNAFNAEYMGAMVPLLLVASAVTLLIEGRIFARLIKRKIRRAVNDRTPLESRVQ